MTAKSLGKENGYLAASYFKDVNLLSEKMCLLDKLNKLDILDTLQVEIKELKDTICAVKSDNKKLRGGYQCMEQELLLLKKENDSLIETVTDLQVRSMSDNLIITGVAETLNENVEEQVWTFFQKQLELKKEEAEEITFVRVHRMGK